MKSSPALRASMIDYEKRRWSSHLFDVRGSMVREIFGRVTACLAWSVVVVLAYEFGWTLTISPTAHTLVGAALGLLLVFRTNASYDRYWEGRRQWGTITNSSRNLVRACRAYVAPAAPDLAERVGLWTAAFAHAVMTNLRGAPGLGPLTRRLPPVEAGPAFVAPHLPSAVAERVSRTLAEARDRGVISDVLLAQIEGHVSQLVDACGACERIARTPVPFVYVVHLRRALVLYCFTLPFALITLYGGWTVPAILCVAYVFFGIEEIGVEIENPFGLDANDLPLEQFCQTIERDALGAFASETPEPEPEPSQTLGGPTA